MKKIIFLVAFAGIISIGVKAQPTWMTGASFFNKGKCELGFNLGGGAGLFAEHFGIGLDVGFNFSYSLTDWLKIATPVDYSFNMFIGDDGFVNAGLVKIPVIAAFKVLKGHIGIGVQQNLVIHKSAELSPMNFNAFCVVLDFGMWSHWIPLNKYTSLYSAEGAVRYLRIGYSLNEIGYKNNKGHYYFLSMGKRFNFTGEGRSKGTRKKSSRSRR